MTVRRTGVLPELDGLVFGGHDVVDTPLVKLLERLVAGGVVPPPVASLVAPDLAAVEAELVTVGAGSQWEIVQRMAGDIRAFAARHELDRVVAINVASTEAPYPLSSVHESAASLRTAVDGADVLPASSLAALADPAHAASKNTSKERGLSELLGDVEGDVHIDYVDAMGTGRRRGTTSCSPGSSGCDDDAVHLAGL